MSLVRARCLFSREEHLLPWSTPVVAVPADGVLDDAAAVTLAPGGQTAAIEYVTMAGGRRHVAGVPVQRLHDTPPRSKWLVPLSEAQGREGMWWPCLVKPIGYGSFSLDWDGAVYTAIVAGDELEVSVSNGSRSCYVGTARLGPMERLVLAITHRLVCNRQVVCAPPWSEEVRAEMERGLSAVLGLPALGPLLQRTIPNYPRGWLWFAWRTDGAMLAPPFAGWMWRVREGYVLSAAIVRRRPSPRMAGRYAPRDP